MTYILQAPDARLFCDLSAHSSTNPLFLTVPAVTVSNIFWRRNLRNVREGQACGWRPGCCYWPGPPVSGRRPAATAGGFAEILDREPRFRGLRMVGPGERRVMESREAE